jgi:precorrin-6A/cobalt-precorrin-6A reductase
MSSTPRTARILILGGTTEARQLAALLAARGADATVSLAGRTSAPVPHALPVRTGGFGGAAGLAQHLRTQRIAALVDATHPYAARMSTNAADAAREAGVPILALRRPGWERQPGDDWTEVADAPAAAAALGDEPKRVFLALGRQEVASFAAAPQHRYLIRSVEPVGDAAPSGARHILARGPFDAAAERALLQAERIDILVCKNSGGDATYGKIAAARDLCIPILMLRRPVLPALPEVATAEDALAWLDHAGMLPPGTDRGV